MTLLNSLCAAIDTADLSKAQALVGSLAGHIGMIKLGMEFIYAHGIAGYNTMASQGVPIFLDLKLHDIPNTVAQGLTSLMALKPDIINVHAAGGLAMMRAARQAVRGDTKLIAVTILTSLSDDDLAELGFDADKNTSEQALNLALLAQKAGLDGVVCSPHDLPLIRENLPREFLTVVPGIRPADLASHDQKRVATPKAALAAGADILVIGRAITAAADPALATQAIMQGLY